MILAQEFKTFEGALKRAAFERAHSRRYHYTPRRFYREHDDAAAVLDRHPFLEVNMRLGRYHWRLERLER